MLKTQSSSPIVRSQLAAQKVLMVVLLAFAVTFIFFEAYAIFKIAMVKFVTETRQSMHTQYDIDLPHLSQTPCQTLKVNKVDVNSISVTNDFFRYLAVHLQNTTYPGINNYVQYMIAHLGLRSLDNVESLRPDFGIVLNDVRSFNYTLRVPPCRPAYSNMSMFIAITSAPRNFEKRQMIRQTWLGHRESYSHQLDVVGIAFLLGLTDDPNTGKAVALEHETHGDVLQVDMIDNYYNLSLKDAGLFNWLDEYCNSVDFFLRMDDDVYVNFNNLVRVMQLLEPNTPAIYGSYSGSLPLRGKLQG